MLLNKIKKIYKCQDTIIINKQFYNRLNNIYEHNANKFPNNNRKVLETVTPFVNNITKQINKHSLIKIY